MITKPLDFTGCHPEVAEALKQGLSIKCICNYKNEGLPTEKRIVIYYNPKELGPKYRTYSEKYGLGWSYSAKPAKVKQVLKPIEEIIPLMLAHGWRFDQYNTLKHPLHSNLWAPRYLQDNAGKEMPNHSFPDYLFDEIEE